MKIYIAGRYIRRLEFKHLAKKLELRGHTVVSRWLDGEEGMERHAIAQMDLEDVLAADCILSVTEDPRIPTPRGGRHVEFGAALAANALGGHKRLIIAGPRENVFHWHQSVETYPSIQRAVDALDKCWWDKELLDEWCEAHQCKVRDCPAPQMMTNHDLHELVLGKVAYPNGSPIRPTD